MTSFSTPTISLESTSTERPRTLPELIEFHIQANPHHLFCLQAEKKPENEGYSFIPVNYERLRHAIHRCQAWLRDHAPELHSPARGPDGAVVRCAPVVILMESDLGLAVYMLTLMGLGIPAVLLSTRLSPLAVQHLVRATGAKCALVSPRLQPLMAEAFPATNGSETTGAGDEVVRPVIHEATGYHYFLEQELPATSFSLTHPDHYTSETDRQVVILHSSGSSGLPKPIYCSHRSFLGFAVCHSFETDEQAQAVVMSTSPFFHGFGMVPICLSLGIGKTFCIPPSSVIPTGASVTAMVRDSGVKGLMTVPSILEEIALVENGLEVLQKLDFVAFGGGLPKASAGEKLDAAGVRLINHYGATETGPLTPFFVPPANHNWRHLWLRKDTIRPLELKLEPVDEVIDEPGKHAYKLSMKPLGWPTRFELQDLLVGSSGDLEGEFAITGRTDDLICLATGEKVRPTILESRLRQHDDVKAAVAFGDHQFEIGVVVESAKELLAPDEVEAFKSSIWPAIEAANGEMDAHARISSRAAILVVAPGALPRSDKGTISRVEVAKTFAGEIADVYRAIDLGLAAQPLDLASPAAAVRALIRDNIAWRVAAEDWSDDRDFFELGMDSLQATKLRRLLAASVKATIAAAAAAEAAGSSAEDDASTLLKPELPDDIVYRNPSVEKLARAIMVGSPDSGHAPSESPTIDQLAEKYSLSNPSLQQQTGPGKSTVVLTGATGSLGAHFVARLLDDASVKRVVCLNRPGGKSQDALERQKQALKSRGITLAGGGTDDEDAAWRKVVVYETNTAAPRLGLSEPDYAHLVEEVTHLVHIAWPMSFKMALPSFDASFRTLQNLISLTAEARQHMSTTLSSSLSSPPPRLIFISSIATVGNLPRLRGERIVPESFVDDADWAVVLDLGYAQAKLVGEKMVQRARAAHPGLQVGVVRVGQLSGSTRSGQWNADEHLAAIVRSSQKVRKFPDLQGTLSWIPVDLASAALAEILFDSQRSLAPVYHLENPIRQSWQEVTRTLVQELGLDAASSLVPMRAWLEAVASAPDGLGNPAKALEGFLREHFVHMACGSLILDTAVARASSPTLRKMEPLSADTLRAYVAYWRRIKVLE